MAKDRPSDRLVLQRIRNRIIEYLETTASIERQRTEAVSPDETINGWEDWVNSAWLPAYVPPIFSAQEREAIRSFHAVWDQVADAVPDDVATVADVEGLPEWRRLCEAAEAALAAFAARGKLPEDAEVE